MSEFRESVYLREKALVLTSNLRLRLDEYVHEFPAGEALELIDITKAFLEGIETDLKDTQDPKLLRMFFPLINGLSGILEFLDNAHSAQTPRGLVQLLKSTSRDLLGEASLLVSASAVYNYSISDLVPRLRELSEKALSPPARDKVRPKLQKPFYVVRFPRTERDNILAHAIFGHEFGHPVADEFISHHEKEALYQQRFQEAQRKLEGNEDVAKWLASARGTLERRKFANQIFDDLRTIHRRALQELVSDAFAVYVFGPSAGFAAVDVLLQAQLDFAPRPREFYPPNRYRFRLMYRLMRELGYVDGLNSLKLPPGLEEVKTCVASLLQFIDSTVAADTDQQALKSDPVVGVAYEWVNETLDAALQFARSRAESRMYDAGVMVTEVPELLQRLWLQVPPSEVGIWPDLKIVDWRSSLAAGWLMKLYQVSVVNFAGADRQVALDTTKRLTLKGVEMALLRADFEKFSSAPPTSL